MFFLQVPKTEDIAKDVSHTFQSLQSGWTEFWQLFWNNPVEALKYIGSHAIGIAIKIVIALLIFYFGRFVIRKVKKIMAKIFERKNVDSSIRIFLNHLINIVLGIILLVIIIAVLGIDMTGLVAIFAAAAFAIGMALSGTLSNFAGGVLILLLKPYRIGDYIEAEGYGGTVKSIELFHTILTTPDNKTVILPNGPLATGNINNFSRQNTRRVEWVVGISYGDDFDQAKKVIQAILDRDERIIKKLGTIIAINELTLNSVNVVIRAWTKSENYWDLFFETNEKLYKELPANGVMFPFNQIDVRVTNTGKTV